MPGWASAGEGMDSAPVTVRGERNPDQTRRRILEAAFIEMYRNGFQGMRLDEVTAASALTKGALYRGATNSAGEWGHTKIVLHGRQCRCGGQGCLEAYVGAPGQVPRLLLHGEEDALFDGATLVGPMRRRTLNRTRSTR